MGEYWQIAELEFHDTADGSGTKIDPDDTIASSFLSACVYDPPADPTAYCDDNLSDHKVPKAFDGDEATYWSASNNLKFEWLGGKFNDPKDIRSIKIKLHGGATVPMGPPMFIVEKSMDGDEWTRVNEVSDAKQWASSLETFPLLTFDTVPPSIFAIRSQVNPQFCIGIREKPAQTNGVDDPDLPTLPCEENQPLEIQICDDAKNTQYWQMPSSTLASTNGALTQYGSAYNTMYKIHHVGNVGTGSGALTIKKCTTEASDTQTTQCNTFVADTFKFGEEALGGLVYSDMSVQDDSNAYVPLATSYVMKADALEVGSPVKLVQCGTDTPEPADIANCASLTDAQFELKPLFEIEDQKKVVTCAPYSHKNMAPQSGITDRQQIQRMCAAECTPDFYTTPGAACVKNDCMAYNWDKTNELGWLCSSLTEVHSNQPNWELGVRGGSLVPFVEEAKRRSSELRDFGL